MVDTPGGQTDRDQRAGRVWSEFYDGFGYFDEAGIREGCHAWRMVADPPGRHGLVLVHGLTDSPHFMRAIADSFHRRLGFNVFLPLLQGHGLREPKGMQGVRLEEWKRNVNRAIEAARDLSETVSIGGLSTGGTLSVDAALNPRRIDGIVLLFSAALDLGGPLGDIKERLLRGPVARWLDRLDDRTAPSLIGDNPYRYARMDKGGASQLARLIQEVEGRTQRRETTLSQPVFAAHSEADRTAAIEGIETLLRHLPADRSELFRFGRDFSVPHASVVLRDPILSLGNRSPLEPANPFFGSMIEAAHVFARRHLP